MISGITLVDHKQTQDNRGGFSKVLSSQILEKLEMRITECSISSNTRAGTIRGFHFQSKPYGEKKLVTCIKGSIFDVVVDVRHESPTYGNWMSFTLKEDSGFSILIAPGIAHGYQTLTDAAELLYHMDVPQNLEYSRNLYWRDKHLAIPWPLELTTISVKDENATKWPVQY